MCEARLVRFGLGIWAFLGQHFLQRSWALAMCRAGWAACARCRRASLGAVRADAAVDWIIQYDPPDDPREYIHRVGRTARGRSGKGRALLMLLPEELGFLTFLKARSVLGSNSTLRLGLSQPRMLRLVLKLTVSP